MKHLPLLSALVFAVAACGAKAAEPITPAQEHEQGHHEGKASGAPVKAPGDANVGDTTKCPVSGEEFVVDSSSPHAEHNGKTYYFCCGGCKKKFEANPDTFLNK